MAILNFQSLMQLALRILESGQDPAPATLRDAPAAECALTGAALMELLPSGRQTTLANRVAWAHASLKQAGVVASPRPTGEVPS